MDDASFAKLHSKVYMRGFALGSTIYERDAPSETAYIVLHGSVSVSVLSLFIVLSKCLRCSTRIG